MEENTPSEKKPKLTVAAKKSLVLLGSFVIIALLVAYLLGPSWSPIQSVRDTDGDGVSDAEDYAPTDESKWAKGTAHIYISMDFSVVDTSNYTINFNGEFETRGWVNFSEHAQYNTEMTWLYGAVNYTSLSVDWVCDGSHYNVRFHVTGSWPIPEVEDGGEYYVYFSAVFSP